MKYQIKSTLQGPQDAVTSLAFTVQGKLLAAAGPGGVSVWSLATSQLVPLVSGIGGYQQPERTAFPVVAWLFYKEQSRHVLMLGSWDGQLQFWDYVDERSTLESTRQAVRHTPLAQVISVDIFPKEVPAGGRAKIVTSFADSSVSVWTLSMNGELKKKFTIKLHISFIPKAVRFDTKTNNIYVFAMNGGDIAFLDCHTGNTIWMKNGGPTVMGSISLDPTSENFAVCTSQGFELFELERISYIRKFDGEPIHIAVPKHLSFVEDGSKVLGGTDRGYAALYDVQSGKVVQKLKYSLGGLVQSVAACATNDDFFTAIAGSNGHQRCDVIVWQKPRPIPRSRHMEGNDEYVVLPIKKKSLRRFVYIAGLALSFFGYTAFVTLLSDSIESHICQRTSKLCLKGPSFREGSPPERPNQTSTLVYSSPSHEPSSPPSSSFTPSAHSVPSPSSWVKALTITLYDRPTTTGMPVEEFGHQEKTELGSLVCHDRADGKSGLD